MNAANGYDQEPVTQRFDPIMDDPIIYSVIILAGNAATASTLKAVSKVCGVNYIAAKKVISEGEKALCSGKAWEVIEKKALLDEGGVAYEITPDWPH